MRRTIYLFATCLFILTAGAMLTACSSDDDQDIDDPAEVVVDPSETDVAPSETDVNVLLIVSDNGKTSTGLMYKSNEIYNPPHCYIGQEIRWGNPHPVYHMSFTANIKGSDVFDALGVSFESDQPMSFSNLKAGDTFDSSQFDASASYTPTWTEAVEKVAAALSGNITVVGTKKDGDKNYIVLRLTNLRFNSIDGSCVYAVSGTVEYEIWS